MSRLSMFVVEVKPPNGDMVTMSVSNGNHAKFVRLDPQTAAVTAAGLIAKRLMDDVNLTAPIQGFKFYAEAVDAMVLIVLPHELGVNEVLNALSSRVTVLSTDALTSNIQDLVEARSTGEALRLVEASMSGSVLQSTVWRSA